MTESVCYLDFDGVLHHDAVFRRHGRGISIDSELAPGRTLFEWAPVLEEAIAPYPGLRFVLSTSWVRALGFSKARALLSTALADRVIGATFHSVVHGQPKGEREAFAALPRGTQVLADVARRRPARWFAIDDAVDEWPDNYRSHLVACDSSSGLGSATAQEALAAMLRSVHD